MIWQQIRRLYELSKTTNLDPIYIKSPMGNAIPISQASLEKAIFIPRVKKTSLEQITEVANQPT